MIVTDWQNIHQVTTCGHGSEIPDCLPGLDEVNFAVVERSICDGLYHLTGPSKPSGRQLQPQEEGQSSRGCSPVYMMPEAFWVVHQGGDQLSRESLKNGCVVSGYHARVKGLVLEFAVVPVSGTRLEESRVPAKSWKIDVKSSHGEVGLNDSPQSSVSMTIRGLAE